MRFPPLDFPPTHPGDSPREEICLNHDWVIFLISLCERLEFEAAWNDPLPEDYYTSIMELTQILVRARANMGCCCDDKPVTRQRLTANGTLQISEDGGATWHDASVLEDPRQNGDLNAPPMHPEDGGEKCNMANSFVTFMQREIEEMADKKEAGALGAAIAEMIIGLLVAVGVIATGGALAILGGALGVLVANYDLGSFNSAFTSEVWSDLLCLIRCAIDDNGEISQAQAQTIAAQIQTDHPGIAGDTLKDLINLMGAVGCTNAARSRLGGSLSCDGCGCGECDECSVFDWSGDYLTIAPSERVIWSGTGWTVYESGYVVVPAGESITFLYPEEICVQKIKLPVARFSPDPVYAKITISGGYFEVDELPGISYSGIPNASYEHTFTTPRTLTSIKIECLSPAGGALLITGIEPYICIEA